MRSHSTAWPALFAATLGLAGCNSADGRYPSLAQRPAERAYALNPAPVPAAPVTAPVTSTSPLQQRAAALHAAATRDAGEFAKAAEPAQRLARAAGSQTVGSEAWAAATVALARLDGLRSATALSQSELDALLVSSSVGSAEANTAQAAADYDAVAAADSAVAAIVSAEDAQIAALHSAPRE